MNNQKKKKKTCIREKISLINKDNKNDKEI